MGYRAYPEMRDSGVEWIKRIPAHWHSKRLKFSVSLINEKVEAESSELSYMGLEHIESWSGKRIEDSTASSEGVATKFLPKDVLFGKLRPYLAKVHLASHEGLASTEALILRSQPEVSAAYLRYFLVSKDFINIVDSSTYGSKMPRASWDFIGNLPMLHPSLPEQQTIARFLDHKTAQIDALIAKKEALLQKLAEKRTALISQAVTQGLDPAGSMKDSGAAWLGKIPKDWKQVSLARAIVKIEQGWSPSCEERIAASDEWGVLKSGCVNGGVFRESDHKTLPADIAPPKALEVKAGDILMCRASGSKHLIGSVAEVETCRPQLIFSDKTYRITLNASLVTSEFFALAMGSRYLRDQIELSISGADGLANNIPQSSVKAYRFLAPPLAEQQALVSSLSTRLAPMATTELAVRNAIDKFKEYRATLITAAVTGKIDVRGAPLHAEVRP